MLAKHWILVANASHARLFERSSFNEPLVEVADWLKPESRMQARETERAPLGHSVVGRAGLAPRSDPSSTIAASLRKRWPPICGRLC